MMSAVSPLSSYTPPAKRTLPLIILETVPFKVLLISSRIREHMELLYRSWFPFRYRNKDKLLRLLHPRLRRESRRRLRRLRVKLLRLLLVTLVMTSFRSYIYAC